MSQLLEHILDGDFISANELFESKMAELQEKKLCESKKALQAEAFGGLTKQEIEDRKKAGYRRAADVLGDPMATKVLSGAKKKLIKMTAKKKKVEEAVNVQPDPEGRVRGGRARPVKGTFRRKAAAAVLKTARKLGTAAGDVAVRASRAKGSWDAYKAQKQSQSHERPASQFPDSMHQTQSQAEPVEKMPNIVKRNVNTLLGRAPDYDASKVTQADKIKSSGRAGRFIRGQAGEVLSNIKSAAQSTWEE